MRSVIPVSLPTPLLHALDTELARRSAAAPNTPGPRRRLSRSAFLVSLLHAHLQTLGIDIAPMPVSDAQHPHRRAAGSQSGASSAKLFCRVPASLVTALSDRQGPLFRYAQRAAKRPLRTPATVAATILAMRYCVPVTERLPFTLREVHDQTYRANTRWVSDPRAPLIDLRMRVPVELAGELGKEARALKANPQSFLRALILGACQHPETYALLDIVVGPDMQTCYENRPVRRHAQEFTHPTYVE